MASISCTLWVAAAVATEGSFHDAASAQPSDVERWRRYADPGVEHLAEKRYDRAIELFTAALQRDARGKAASRVYELRGDAYAGKGDMERARADYARAAQYEAKTAEEYSDRAYLHQKRGDYKAAIADYSRAAELRPNEASFVNSIAWVKATALSGAARDGKAAIQLAQRACEMRKWKNSDFIDTLAAAHAEAGDFTQAVAFQKRAVEMVSRFHPSRKGKEERLALYQRKKPYREDPLKDD